VLRAAGVTETTQDWLQLDEGDPGFQLLSEEEIAEVIFFLFIFISAMYIIKFSTYLFPKSFLSFRATFCFTNPDYRLIRTTPQLIRIREGLL
jgi:hypothetical protein